jgi:uncharacterized repeat protein (TIGR01451 family)
MLIISPSLGEIEINITKTVVPENVLACEDAVVWINVTATGTPSEIRKPLDVMLVIDRSASMSNTYNGQTVLYWTKQAAKSFVGDFNSSMDRIGLVSYHTTASENQQLTSNFNAVNTSIDGLAAGTFTNMGEGIRVAQLELTERGRADALKFIVLFTDGVPTARLTTGSTCTSGLSSPNTYCIITDNLCTNYARDQGTAAKAASTNTTILSLAYLEGLCSGTIGGCTNTSPNFYCGQAKTLSRNILKDVASKDEYFFEAPTPDKLGEIFDTISKIISDIAAANLIVVDYVAPDIILLDSTGNSIQFNLATLSLNESWNNSIDITTNVTGTGIPTNDPNSYIKYTLPNGTEVNQTLPVPTINVQLPLTLAKTAPEEVIQGDPFNYTIELNHIGSLDVANLTINDTLCNNVTYVSHSCAYTGPGSSSPLNTNYYPGSRTLWINTTGPLEGGDKIVCNITVYVNEDCNEDAIFNGVTAVYDRYPCILAQTVTDITQLIIKRPNFTVVKVAENDPDPAIPGTQINFTIWINNTGNVNLTKNSVEDRLEGIPYPLPEPAESISLNGVLNVSETWMYKFNITANIADICDGWINNTVEANFSYKKKFIEKNDSANVSTIYTAAFEINKTAEYDGQPNPAIPGTLVNYTIWINNTGNVNLTEVDVTDSLYDLGSIAIKSGDDQGTEVLNVSERWKYEFNFTIPLNPNQWYNNTVTANFTDPCDKAVNGSDWANVSTTVCQTADAGNDTIVCSGVAALLQGNATGYDSVEWNITAGCSGTLVYPIPGNDPPFNATYTPPLGESQCNLTFTATGPCANVTDNATVYVVETPVADIKVIEPSRYAS